MRRETDRAHAARIGCVLAGVIFPAARWQLITHAEHYGADAATVAELWAIPVGTYHRIDAVITAARTGRSARSGPPPMCLSSPPPR